MAFLETSDIVFRAARIKIKAIEYRSDDVTKKLQRFGYHSSVEHDEKHPQPKFGGNRLMGARDMAR